MADEEKILSIVRMRGPVLPVDIAKGVETNILLASAYLSELVSRKKVKISSLKVGGSPVYYLPGQEVKLEQFAGNLNEKEFRAYESLKEKKMLRDGQLTPLMRVALRNIKDFAVPLTVTFENKQELFWKWHLVKDEEVTPLIRKELGAEEKKEEVVVPEVKEKIEGVRKEVVEEEPTKKEEVVVELQMGMITPKRKVRRKRKVEKKSIKEKPLVEVVKEEKKVVKEKKIVEKGKYENEGFIGRVQKFFKEKEIKVLQEEIVRKGAEVNYVIKIPSSMGELQYLCKARNKKKSTDKDLSSALVEGQLKKMPVVFLYSGAFSAKAEEMTKTEPFKTMTFYKLG